MKFRVEEEKFENKTNFNPEWFCSDKKACNYGWNPVHDEMLMTTPCLTFKEAKKRIEWFSECFEAPYETKIHTIN